MKRKYLDAGEVVNTHGIRGEVKIVPWCDGANFLAQFKTLYVGRNAYHVQSSRIHKQNLICKFQEINDVDAAKALKGKKVKINRNDAKIPAGRVFISDLIGLPVYNGDIYLGKMKNVLTLPANDVYVVVNENREIMIPAVSEFLDEVNIDEGFVRLKKTDRLLESEPDDSLDYLDDDCDEDPDGAVNEE